MSADKPLNRRVPIRMTIREKNDPVAVLAAIRNAFSSEGIYLEVRTVPDEGPVPAAHVTESAAVTRDEVLETASRELAHAVLGAAAAGAGKKRAAAERDTERVRAEVEAQRAGLVSYLSYWLGQGVRITVEIYEKSIGAAVGAVSRAFGGKGGESD